MRSLRTWASGPRLVVVAVALALLGTATPAASQVAERADDQPAAPDWRQGNLAQGWIDQKLGRMSLEEKVGQLFMTYAYGETADTDAPGDVSRNQSAHGVDNAQQLIEKYHLGGMIYFAWSNNVNNPHQIAGLSNGVQRVAMDQPSGLPLLISTDQEQGIVVRVGAPATQFPGNMALGAGRSTQDAQTAARITGQELRALGINQNFAPVADVNVNALNPVIGVRSFGEDPTLAAALTAAQTRGYQQRDGVSATAKHFPGHGDTDVDSHFGFPVINHTREEWERLDAPPFRAAAAAGIDAIMTAHIQVPALDPSGDPATLSRPIMTGLLRNEMGYDGVVVTDSLGMAGVREKYGDDRVPVLALQAGVDMLLMPPNIDVAYNAVLNAVRDGELTERRIEKSVARILRLKFYRGLARDPYADPSKIDSIVGTPQHLAVAEQVTERTTTLIANDAGLLPLDQGSRNVLVTGWGVATTRTIGDHFADRGAAADVYSTGASPSDTAISNAVAKAEASDLVVVTSMNAWGAGNARQRTLVKQLVATGTPVIVLGVRDPYDIAYFTEAETYLATYSYTAIGLETAVKVIFGEVSPSGKLPVTIPVAGDPDTPLYPYGHGLSY
ncbi:MAG: glycoside hydrolase family 3 protein [Micromonosporaceae bacterium]|nr:glycoside hydrolase family 3 protein [Micromonosporaceae bacterium]